MKPYLYHENILTAYQQHFRNVEKWENNTGNVNKSLHLILIGFYMDVQADYTVSHKDLVYCTNMHTLSHTHIL